MALYAGAAERFRITSGGNVGIGTSSPSSVLHLSTSNDPKITLTDTGAGASADITGSNGNLRLNSQTATIFDMADSEIARFDSSGNFLVGKTATTLNTEGQALTPTFARFTRDGAAPVQFNRTTDDGDVTIFYKDGTEVGVIGAKAGDLIIGTGTCGLRFIDGDPSFSPVTTNGGTLNENIDRDWETGQAQRHHG